MDELPLEAETVERGYSLTNKDPTGLPTSSMYSSGSSSMDYTASPKNQRSRSKSSNSGELNSNSSFYGNSEYYNGNNRNSLLGLYPTSDL